MPDSDFDRVEHELGIIAQAGIRVWRTKHVDVTPLLAAPAVAKELRTIERGMASSVVEQSAIERAVERAARSLPEPFASAALDQFGYSSAGKLGIGTRQLNAAQHFQNSDRWYRHESRDFYGLQPQHYVVRLVAAALFEVEDPRTFVAGLALEPTLGPTQTHQLPPEHSAALPYETKHLLIITAGGTITESCDTDPFEPRDVLAPTVAQIDTEWNTAVTFGTAHVSNVDSADIEPAHWTSIVNAIADNYDAYHGFIVTHGTNTMGYTCAALSFALPNLTKPVIVTGSQIPLGAPASDAIMNLHNAVRLAAYPLERIRGVVCVFGSHIITGTRVKKSTEFDLDAFQIFGNGRLGRIGRTIQINEANLALHDDYLSQQGVQAFWKSELVLQHSFDMHLLSFTEFPGMNPDMFRAALEPLVEPTPPLLHGLIFRAFGAGDVSHRLHPVFEYLADNSVPVVVTTQAPDGKSDFLTNTPGIELGKLGWAIPAHDMSIEAITTKLAWLLAQGTPYHEMRKAMHEDLHGEISRRSRGEARVSG